MNNRINHSLTRQVVPEGFPGGESLRRYGGGGGNGVGGTGPVVLDLLFWICCSCSRTVV